MRKSLGLPRASDLSPIVNNRLFTPSYTDLTFKFWRDKGMTKLRDLYDQGTFMSFTELQKKFDLPRSHLFRFFQIRHFILNQNPKFPSRPPETILDSLLVLDSEQKHLISSIYNLLNSTDEIPTSGPQGSWEQELGTALSEEYWQRALKPVHSSSICATHGLLQCKVVHRTHYTNLKLSRIYPNVADSCNRCKQSPANHSHMFRFCPRLAT